jgi:hypothetical protein
MFRKSLKSLQHAGGAYCVVAAHKDHDVRASLRGFQEGDNLRVLRAKEEKVAAVEVIDAHLPPKAAARYPGYALKMTWDVPVGKATGIFKVNVCWHEIVFRNEWGFSESNFLH